MAHETRQAAGQAHFRKKRFYVVTACSVLGSDLCDCVVAFCMHTIIDVTDDALKCLLKHEAGGVQPISVFALWEE